MSGRKEKLIITSRTMLLNQSLPDLFLGRSIVVRKILGSSVKEVIKDSEVGEGQIDTSKPADEVPKVSTKISLKS